MLRSSDRSLALVCLGASLLVVQAPARAQLRAPRAGPERVPVTSVRAIVLHHGDRQDLVLELGYEVELPLTDVVWALPLPSNAEWFGAVEGDPFTGVASAAPEAPLADVAPFAMQPLRVRGAEATSALSTWLRDGGLHAVSDDDLSYYTERDWTFFLTRIRPPEGSTLPATARLPALHVTFRSERAILPLRLMDARGAAVSITLLTATAPDDDALRGARAAGFDIEEGTLVVAAADPALTAVLSRSSAFPMGNAPGGTLARTTLRARSLGDASRWTEELSVPGAERRERLTGVADRELGPELPLMETGTETESAAPASESASTATEPAGPVAREVPENRSWVLVLVAVAVAALAAAAWRMKRPR